MSTRFVDTGVARYYEDQVEVVDWKTASDFYLGIGRQDLLPEEGAIKYPQTEEVEFGESTIVVTRRESDYRLTRAVYLGQFEYTASGQLKGTSLTHLYYWNYGSYGSEASPWGEGVVKEFSPNYYADYLDSSEGYIRHQDAFDSFQSNSNQVIHAFDDEPDGVGGYGLGREAFADPSVAKYFQYDWYLDPFGNNFIDGDNISNEEIVLTREIAEALIAEQGLDVVIPDGYTSIEGSAFNGKNLTSIEIPNSVTAIGDYAFEANQLTSVEIPGSVIVIGDWAFAENQLTSVVIPDSVTTIGYSAFRDNRLTTVEIPDSLTTISDAAFAENRLTSVEIPGSVTTIGDEAFSLNRLTSVVIPDSVTTIRDFAFAQNQLTSVEIPDSVTTIGDWAFALNQLTSVEIPDSVTTIGDYPFEFNQLTSVVIPNGVSNASDFAYGDNFLVSDGEIIEIKPVLTREIAEAIIEEQGTDITIPFGYQSIVANSFGGNSLTRIEIPDSVLSIGGFAFGWNQLSSIAIPESVIRIGESAFSGNQLTELDIPNSVTYLSGFSHNQLESIQIPDGVITIGNSAFHDNQLTSVDIPDGVTAIGDWAFSDNQLTSVKIPAGVITIGERAFTGNELTSIEIPDSVTTIGERAFTSNELTSVEIPDDSKVHPNAFSPGVEVIRRSMKVERFQVENLQSYSHGLTLQLNGTPDMNVFALYVGTKSDNENPSLVLTNSSDVEVNLSAHWEDDTKQLHLLSNQVLEDGEYTLKIRADGLVSQSGDLLDGNGDGVDGHDYVHTFTHASPDHFISVGDTARSAGQDLSINGKDLKDGITGIPIHLSTTSPLRSVSGEISFDADLLKDVSLAKGSDLPSDWVVNYSQSSPGTLSFTISGQTGATGSIEDTLRLIGQVDANASDSYGSTSLIQASITESSDGQITFKSDPGLLVNAYSGDTTGNGTHSSLDASRVQRVVVGLDSGFDAFDDINPVLIGDTTGNGSLSSLDASRIQQEVVGLPVDTFPEIPII